METSTYEPQRGLTFDDVWAALMETRKHQEENALQIKETDRQIEETNRQMKETDRKLGRLGNRFGELVEHLVAPNIEEKFNALGYHFDRVFQGCKITRPEGTSAEIDLLLTNEEFTIAIEVKAKPNDEDVKDHVRRLEIIRQDMDKQHDSRKLRGAIAGGIMSDAVRNYALKTGLYVIEQSGDTVKIDIPPNFIPREW
jgi:hypothetical protein